MSDLATKEAIISGWFQEDAKEIFKGVPIGESDTVVDVGCGRSGNIHFCARMGAHVTAVDLNEHLLSELANTLSDTAPGRFRTIVGNASTIPVETAYATRVLCTEVLEHVEDTSIVLSELVRIGKPGALYLLSVPGEAQENLQKLVAHPNYFAPPNHIRIIGRDQFVQMVTDAGLEVLSVSQQGFFWSIWMALWWTTKRPLHQADHPALKHWESAWEAILNEEDGPWLKGQLDSFLPKSVVIVARKRD